MFSIFREELISGQDNPQRGKKLAGLISLHIAS